MHSYRLAGFNVTRYMGSANIMSVADHQNFITTGRRAISQEFREAEADLLRQGKFMEAFDLNANAIREHFPGKYDEDLRQAREHFQENVVPELQKQLNDR